MGTYCSPKLLSQHLSYQAHRNVTPSPSKHASRVPAVGYALTVAVQCKLPVHLQHGTWQALLHRHEHLPGKRACSALTKLPLNTLPSSEASTAFSVATTPARGIYIKKNLT